MKGLLDRLKKSKRAIKGIAFASTITIGGIIIYEILKYPLEKEIKFPNYFEPRHNYEIQELIKNANRQKHKIYVKEVVNQTTKNGGTVIDLRKMNAIKEINIQEKKCSVETGITIGDLNRELEKYNLEFPIRVGDEQSVAYLLYNNSLGLAPIKSAPIKRWITNTICIMSDGRILNTATNLLLQPSTPINLNDIMIGSMGSLGIIVEAQLLLQEIPKYISTYYVELNPKELTPSNTEELLIELRKLENLEGTHVQISPEYCKIYIFLSGEHSLVKMATIRNMMKRIGEKGQNIIKQESNNTLNTSKIIDGLKEGVKEDISLCVPYSKIEVVLKQAHLLIDLYQLDASIYITMRNDHALIKLLLRNSNNEQIQQIINNLSTRMLLFKGIYTPSDYLGENMRVSEDIYTQNVGIKNIELVNGIKDLLDPNSIFAPAFNPPPYSI